MSEFTETAADTSPDPAPEPVPDPAAAPIAATDRFQPIFPKSGVFKLALVTDGQPAPGETGAEDYACEVRSCVVTPDSSIERIKTICRNGQFAVVGSPEWTWEIGYLVGDYAAPSTKQPLYEFLLEHAGERAVAWFRPNDRGRGVTQEVTLLPGPYGGEEGAFSEQSVSLPGEGQPSWLTRPSASTTPTGVTAGAPGSFTPAGATPPADLNALKALGNLAQTTAWTAGQSVQLGDGSEAYWNGTAWTAGKAA